MKIIRRIKLPRTWFLFPVAEDDDCGDGRHDRGVALMVAIMVLSIMMMFIADLIVSSTVNLTQASAQRDNIRAEYLAKSGANWAHWLNLFDYGLQLQLAADPTTKVMKDGIGTLWDKLGTVFPYETGLDLDQVDKFAALMGLSTLMDSKVIDLLKSLGGELGVDVSDETGKVNLNVCYQSPAECSIVIMQLEALMSCTGVEQDYNKQQNIKVSEIVRRLTDWVDKNSVAEPGAGYTDENDAYAKRTPPHKAKNSPIDSVNELLLVDGWSRELHAYYAPYITAWPFQDQASKNGFKLNINTMPQEALRCMFGRELGSPEMNEKFARRYRDLMEKNGRLAGGDTDLQAIIADLFGYKNDAAEKGKPTDKGGWLTTESRAFRIRAKARVGDQVRIAEYVIQRSTGQQLAAGTASGPWSLAFFRMH
jgi:type II secretory pathway component PulK